MNSIRVGSVPTKSLTRMLCNEHQITWPVGPAPIIQPAPTSPLATAMIHSAIDSQVRSATIARIDRALTHLAPFRGRVLLLPALAQLNPSANNFIQVLLSVPHPHLLKALTFFCNQQTNPNISCDLLISSDTRTDSAAAIRDQHISGGKNLVGSLFPTQSPQRVIIDRVKTDLLLVYKALFFNNSPATTVFYLNLELIPLSVV